MATELRAGFDERHLRAEAAQGLRKFQADVAAAENDEMLRDAIEIESFDVRHGIGGGHPGSFGDGGAGTEVEEDAIAFDDARAAGIQGNFHFLGGDKARRAHDQLRARLFIKFQVDLDVAFDHFAFAALDAGHIGGERAEIEAEFGGARGVGVHFGALNNVFAGQAGDVGAGAADKFAFYDCGTMAFAGEGPGDVLPCFPASDDEMFVVFDVGHSLPPWVGFDAPRCVACRVIGAR